MLVNNATKFRIDKQRYKQEYMSPNSGTTLSSLASYSQNNKHDIKRPLNPNSSDLSFKGLSLGLYKPLDKVYSKADFVKFADTYLGKMGKELLDDITVTNKSRAHNLISIDPNNPDNIIISKKTIPHLAWDGIIYPFKILPGDKVKLELSPYDLSRGRITWRAK